MNVSSVHAIVTSENISAYAATKGALLSFTRAIASEFLATRCGLTRCCLAPLIRPCCAKACRRSSARTKRKTKDLRIGEQACNGPHWKTHRCRRSYILSIQQADGRLHHGAVPRCRRGRHRKAEHRIIQVNRSLPRIRMAALSSKIRFAINVLRRILKTIHLSIHRVFDCVFSTSKRVFIVSSPELIQSVQRALQDRLLFYFPI